MSSFPCIFRKQRSDRKTNNSQEMSKSYPRNSNTSTRRSSLTSTCSRSSLWSNSSSGISSLDVSLVKGKLFLRIDIYWRHWICSTNLICNFLNILYSISIEDAPHSNKNLRQDKSLTNDCEIGEVSVMVGKEIITVIFFHY